MNNPLPVDPFSVAEAARRTWPVLIEAMLEAVCLVEPEGLRIVAANGAAGRLLGLHPSELVGRDMLATAPTPEDETFWQRVADDGGCANILSDSYITHARGQAVPVVRRVSRIEPAPGNALYVVALVDRSEQMRVERAAAISTAELAATLESVADGVLVVDLAGHISNFNRRFAAMWELPD
jgi:PAS domain S-box-containing protein